MKRLNVRYSLRILMAIITVMCIYLASWEATKRFGVKPNTVQQSPMPFIATLDGNPHYKIGVNGSPLEMHCDRSYYFWFFGKQHELFTSQLNREWNGLGLREQKELITQRARKRKNALNDQVTKLENNS